MKPEETEEVKVLETVCDLWTVAAGVRRMCHVLGEFLFLYFLAARNPVWYTRKEGVVVLEFMCASEKPLPPMTYAELAKLNDEALMAHESNRFLRSSPAGLCLSTLFSAIALYRNESR
jgi:hypothetical protein